jgi:hypothetical protein
MTSVTPELEREAHLLTRYLLDRACPPDMMALYLDAHVVAAKPWTADPASDRALRFALEHPFTFGPLDAASALTGSAPVLRAKLLLMTAILEASPMFADRFLPAPPSAIRTLVVLAGSGARVLVSLLVGLPLLAIVRRLP